MTDTEFRAAIPSFDLLDHDEFVPNQDRHSPIFPRLTDDDAPEGE